MDLLAHSGGANLAALYAVRHPERVSRLALVTPSVMAVGIETTGEDRLAAARLRHAEPWFAAAFVFAAEGAFDPEATRAALARFGQPALLLAGEVDLGAPPRVEATSSFWR